MIINLEARGKRNFYKMFVAIQGVSYKFNIREEAIAAEFLFMREYYLTNPINKFDEDEEGNRIEVEMSMIEQLRDKRTLLVILQRLDMTFTILRKHVKGLKEKKFFDKGEINKDFITDGISVQFNLKKI